MQHKEVTGKELVLGSYSLTLQYIGRLLQIQAKYGCIS